MIDELDTVVLKRRLPEHHLEQGDVGTVVHLYKDGEALEVEFITGKGETVAVLTLEAQEVRAMESSEILHAREIAASPERSADRGRWLAAPTGDSRGNRKPRRQNPALDAGPLRLGTR